MRKFICLFILSLFACAVSGQSLIKIEVIHIPQNADNNSSIYIAGSFNGWNPKDEKYKLQQDDKATYFINLSLPQGTYEYKITRGSWDKVECKKDGSNIENRALKVEGNATVQITVEEWQDNKAASPIVSTAGKNVLVIDTAFYIPQLKRKRRVWIYLPENYKNYRYPVLYMHDGQNVFDAKTSFSGEWGVDEFLDTAKLKSCIVVGIDNGGDKRLHEYCPYDFTLDPRKPMANKGEGNQYVDFIVKTLKPFIDKKYNTAKDKAHTFIAGSSMGGLISFFAALKYPKVFGGVGVFSPSFWICKPQILSFVKEKGKKMNTRLYFFGGKLEGEQMVADILKVMQQTRTVSKSTMTTVIRDDGKHNEPTWRKEFPFFYEWMMK
jgi:predicted alpha/beta superfamily hydrolase